jgi:hypothetical protein
MDRETIAFFESVVRKKYPSFQVKWKEQSWLMRLVGFLVYPFCPSFMTEFTTTLGTTVYFPRKLYQKDAVLTFVTLAHEFVHIHDRKKHGVWFSLSYFLPQLLIVFPLLMFAIFQFNLSGILLIPLGGYLLGCVLARLHVSLFYVILAASIGSAGYLSLAAEWGALWLLMAALFMVPWPSTWRTRWEARGYAMNLAIAQWKGGALTAETLAPIFTGSGYLFMLWSQTKAMKVLEAALRIALSKQEPYGTVYKFLRSPSIVPKES